jgi:hypothetical protein
MPAQSMGSNGIERDIQVPSRPLDLVGLREMSTIQAAAVPAAQQRGY